MSKKLIIAVITIIVLGTIWLVYANNDNTDDKKPEMNSDRYDYISTKAYHAGTEFDVMEAKKILQEKEKIEEDARLKVQAERQKIGSGLTQ